MAIQDDCIRKNPFEFKLSDVLEDDTEQKVILTPEQEERLLAFMEKDKIFTASIMMRLCFCWKRDFVFLNFAD